ncbi:MAG: hypothetical protein M2R45_04864 [Verrucomicrobia subdivision 3 bacterium]|nr:hypothetical protein [Limisphaerales bacterium]MCS1417529.1 hypothetical protein [Limisphaerales bacterium]
METTFAMNAKTTRHTTNTPYLICHGVSVFIISFTALYFLKKRPWWKQAPEMREVLLPADIVAQVQAVFQPSERKEQPKPHEEPEI